MAMALLDDEPFSFITTDRTLMVRKDDDNRPEDLHEQKVFIIKTGG